MFRHLFHSARALGAIRLELARAPRRNGTPAERFAWSLLRNRRILGLKFRRQHVLRGFIVDFYCPHLRLVLELDGAPHDHAAQAGYDAARSARLRALGYRVVRLRNRELSRNRLEQLLRPFVSGCSSPLSRQGEGDRGRGPAR